MSARSLDMKILLVAAVIFGMQMKQSLSQSRHLIAGSLSGCAGSKILYSRTVWQKAVADQVVVTVVTFPAPGVEPKEVINFINASNQDMSDAGEARIIGGGVGQKTVKIEFKSKIGYGFNFVLKIYGKPLGV